MPESLLIRTIGVCGAGQMGTAAALCFQRSGYRTLLWARNPEKLAGALAALSELDSWMKQHIGPPKSETGSLSLVSDLSILDDLADVVVDCIAESMDEKACLFRRLPAARHRGALFLTTTSGLSITELATRSGVEKNLVGAHFWNPPHLMPLVEVVRGEKTEEASMVRTIELMKSIGKITVRVNRDVPGFIGNRLLHALWREAIALVQRGIASAEDVDRVARLTFGLRMSAVGPLENMDLVGLDLIKTIHSYLLSDLADEHEPLSLLADLVEKHDLGMKSGQGFYDWRTRDGKQLVERRDRQIVRQLEHLAETGEL